MKTYASAAATRSTLSVSRDKRVGNTVIDPSKASSKNAPGKKLACAAGLFACLAGLWLAIDMATKSFFNGAYAPGDVITEPIAGLFRFRLVHNTGAAWGMFGDSTFALGVMSVVVCVVLLAYFIVGCKSMNTGQIIGLALVFAGGIGNAIDRFTLGYVVDFIDFAFIDFPVFNVADIGVTCGFVIFIASMIFAWKKADEQATAKAVAGEAACGSADDESFEDKTGAASSDADGCGSTAGDSPSDSHGPRQ